jgi:hypothetical protein
MGDFIAHDGSCRACVRKVVQSRDARIKLDEVDDGVGIEDGLGSLDNALDSILKSVEYLNSSPTSSQT